MTCGAVKVSSTPAMLLLRGREVWSRTATYSTYSIPFVILSRLQCREKGMKNNEQRSEYFFQHVAAIQHVLHYVTKIPIHIITLILIVNIDVTIERINSWLLSHLLKR